MKILKVAAAAALSSTLLTSNSVVGLTNDLSESTNHLTASNTIDVLILHTPSVPDAVGDVAGKFKHLESVSNQIFDDSQLDLNVRIVGIEEIQYSETGDSAIALQDMTYQRNGFEQVDQLREKTGADAVIFARPYHSSHLGCGIAWTNGKQRTNDISNYSQYAYSVIDVTQCGDYIMAHELGHNLGLSHSRIQSGVGGTSHYALGHGEYGKFVTTMAYASAFGYAPKAYRFSSPNLDCFGYECGVVQTDTENGADAAYVLSITGQQMAQYKAPTVPFEVNDLPQKAELEKALLVAKEEHQTITQRLNDLIGSNTYTEADNQRYQAMLPTLSKTRFWNRANYSESALVKYEQMGRMDVVNKIRVRIWTARYLGCQSTQFTRAECDFAYNYSVYLFDSSRYNEEIADLNSQLHSSTALISSIEAQLALYPKEPESPEAMYQTALAKLDYLNQQITDLIGSTNYTEQDVATYHRVLGSMVRRGYWNYSYRLESLIPVFEKYRSKSDVERLYKTLERSRKQGCKRARYSESTCELAYQYSLYLFESNRHKEQLAGLQKELQETQMFIASLESQLGLNQG